MKTIKINGKIMQLRLYKGRISSRETILLLKTRRPGWACYVTNVAASCTFASVKMEVHN
jgi:hypothetical protein